MRRWHPDDYLGKRYEWNPEKSGFDTDFTIVGYHPEKGVRVHATDGGRWWLKLNYVRKAIKLGVLVESSKAPFVFDRNQVVTKAMMQALQKGEALRAAGKEKKTARRPKKQRRVARKRRA